jgi:ABC-type proline/glycine betaine transport system substrate-binding protein
MTDHSVSFFIRTLIRDKDNVEGISFENAKTNEKLVIKTESAHDDGWKMLMVSRYPLKAAKSWIEANENEISEWNKEKLYRKINMNESLRIAV